MKLYEYNNSEPKSIETYAKQLIGHTFEEVLVRSFVYEKNSEVDHGFDYGKASVINDQFELYSNSARKGGLGNLLEEKYFGYKANSNQDVDFPNAGVELKVTPFEITKKNKLKAGERLVITMISYREPVQKNFYNTHLWHKASLMLLIYYLRDKSKEYNLEYTIKYVTLFSPPENDLKIITEDYVKIISKIEAGLAHELSEGDTMYLGACTKGSTAAKSLTTQYYNNTVKAKRRAFCFKNSYMTYVLNKYIVNNITTHESIIENNPVANLSFEQTIIRSINKYVGKTDQYLCHLFARVYNNNKAQWIDLAYRMLGIKSNQAEEFIKANIVVKAIRVTANQSIKESSPLPTFKFLDLVNEDWDESTLRDYLEQMKFFFVVFKEEGSCFELVGAKLWNMSQKDIAVAKNGWEDIKSTIEEGVVLKKKTQKDKTIVLNNLPKKNNNAVIHIRPHASKSYYVFENDESFGGGSIKDANELPDGRWMTTHSFWLNNTYVFEQIKDLL